MNKVSYWVIVLLCESNLHCFNERFSLFSLSIHYFVLIFFILHNKLLVKYLIYNTNEKIKFLKDIQLCSLDSHLHMAS